MHFNQKQYYLVDTHQAKDLSHAAKLITKQTNDQIRAAIAKADRAGLDTKKLWYRE